KAALFDQLVCTAGQRQWDSDAKRLGCLEVDEQLVLGRRLHRQVRWLCSPEDAIDVRRGTPAEIDRVGPLGQQAAVDCLAPGRLDGREAVACRQCDEGRTIGEGEGVREHYQTAA